MGNDDPVHELVIAIPAKRMNELEHLLWQVSDPTHAKYGQYLSFDEVGNITSNPQSTAAVLRWLDTVSLSSPPVVSAHGDFVRASAQTSVWNKILSTQFHRYASLLDHTHTAVRAQSYELPDAIRPHIQTIFRATRLPSPTQRPPPRRMSLGDNDKTKPPPMNRPWVYPGVLNRVYSINSNSAQHHGSQGVLSNTSCHVCLSVKNVHS